MADKVIINIIAAGTAKKGGIPERSKAGALPAAGILPSGSKEDAADAPVRALAAQEATIAPFSPTIAGTVVPAEFQDVKTFRGNVARGIATNRSTGGAGDDSLTSYIARSTGTEPKQPSRIRPDVGSFGSDRGVVTPASLNHAASRRAIAYDVLAGRAFGVPIVAPPPHSTALASAIASEPTPSGNATEAATASAMAGGDSTAGAGKTVKNAHRKRRRFSFFRSGTLGDNVDAEGNAGIGARGGLAGRNVHFSRTAFSRLLERANVRGLARFASLSSLGAAVGGIQIGAGVSRIYSQVQLNEMAREADAAKWAYRRMTTANLFSDVLQRGDSIRAGERRLEFAQSMQDFAPLAGIVAALAVSSKFPDMPLLGKLGSTILGAGVISASYAAAVSSFASKGPQAAQYIASTVGEHARPWMLRGGSEDMPSHSFKTTAGIKVDVYGNQHDFTYLAQAEKLLNGQTATRVGGSGAAAAWAGVTSPFDVIRASAARMSSPKIGVGAVGQSTRAAFKAEQETSLPKADNAIFRKLLRDVALRNHAQILKENLYYR